MKKRRLAIKFDVVWAFSSLASRNQYNKGKSHLIREKFFLPAVVCYDYLLWVWWVQFEKALHRQHKRFSIFCSCFSGTTCQTSWTRPSVNCFIIALYKSFFNCLLSFYLLWVSNREAILALRDVTVVKALLPMSAVCLTGKVSNQTPKRRQFFSWIQPSTSLTLDKINVFHFYRIIKNLFDNKLLMNNSVLWKLCQNKRCSYWNGNEW